MKKQFLDNFLRLYGELSLNGIDTGGLQERCVNMHSEGYEGIYLSDVLFVSDTNKTDVSREKLIYEEENAFLLERPRQQLQKIKKVVCDAGLRCKSAHFLQTLPPPGGSLEWIFGIHERLLRTVEFMGLEMVTTHIGWMFGVGEESVMGDAAKKFAEKKLSVEKLHRAACEKYGGIKKVYRDSVDIYRNLCRIAEEIGVAITVETFCSECPDVTYSPEGLIKFIKDVGASNMGVCVDTGHGHMRGLDLAGMIRGLGDFFIETHFHDNYGTRDEHNPIGKGTIDWPEVINAMTDANYQGVITFEQSDFITNAKAWRKLLS